MPSFSRLASVYAFFFTLGKCLCFLFRAWKAFMPSFSRLASVYAFLFALDRPLCLLFHAWQVFMPTDSLLVSVYAFFFALISLHAFFFMHGKCLCLLIRS